MSTLYIFRGLPGSGKTTAANKLGCLVISPQDMFAMRDGKYCFDERNREMANHASECIMRIMLSHGADVAIAEVMPYISKINKYKELAKAFHYSVVVQDMPCTVEESIARNTHNVPEEVIRSMYAAFQPYKTAEGGQQ